MEDRNLNRMNIGMSDVVLGCVMPYIHDPKDRDAVSLVCKRWYELDAQARDDRALLHHEYRSAAAPFSAPRISEA